MEAQNEVFGEGEGTHPLFHAIQDDQLDTMKQILRDEPGAVSLFYSNWTGTPLIYALLDSKYEAASYIVEHGPEQDWDFETPSGSSSGFTALEAACMDGQVDIVKALVKRGADPALVTKKFRTTPLRMALDRKNPADKIEEMVAYLLTFPSVRASLHDGTLARNCYVSDGTPVSVLSEACALTDPSPSIVRRLLDAGADATFPSGEGSPLKHITWIKGDVQHDAAKLVKAATVEALLKTSIDESVRVRWLYRARLLTTAAHAVTAVTLDARKKALPYSQQRQREVDAAPACLKGRVAAKQSLPVLKVRSPPSLPPAAMEDQPVVTETQAGVLSGALELLPEDLFTELMKCMLPSSDFAWMDEPLGNLLDRASMDD